MTLVQTEAWLRRREAGVQQAMETSDETGDARACVQSPHLRLLQT